MDRGNLPPRSAGEDTDRHTFGKGGTGAALAAQLTELKTRSGLSYEQLGRKAHLSRLAKLYRLWEFSPTFAGLMVCSARSLNSMPARLPDPVNPSRPSWFSISTSA
jgi:hypothetical protein